jgi:DNA-binding NtrC family response regulator
LARRFLAEALAERNPGSHAPPLQEPVSNYLLHRSFPGNVRELRQLMVRIASRHVGDGPITVGDLPEDERPMAATLPPDWRSVDFDIAVRRALSLGAGLRDISAHAADVAIRIAVGEEEGNLQRAARRLGVTDRALQMRKAGK